MPVVLRWECLRAIPAHTAHALTSPGRESSIVTLLDFAIPVKTSSCTAVKEAISRRHFSSEVLGFVKREHDDQVLASANGPRLKRISSTRVKLLMLPGPRFIFTGKKSKKFVSSCSSETK